MPVRFTSSFSTAYYDGGIVSSEVPWRFDVAIAGRGYMLDRDLLANQPMISSIRAMRSQADSSQEPGDQSVTPNDLWRRPQDTWHFGAGQDHLDRIDSDRRRFRSSKGIDIWTDGEIGLLSDVTQALSSSTISDLIVAGNRIYAMDGSSLRFSTDLTAWTNVSGLSGTLQSITTDGYRIWVSNGSTVFQTDAGSSSATSWASVATDRLSYQKGRLMYAAGNVVGYVSNMGTPTFTPLFTHANPSWQWAAFGEGPTHIYAAGKAGGRSQIYKIAITAEGTALAAPVAAGTLPDGETVHSLGSYLGFLFLGTSKGVRFCTISQSGDLTIGARIDTGQPVRCFEGQGEFVWFGWSRFDAVSSGLGRLNLRTFSDLQAGKPAYASDLMVSSQNDVLSVVTFDDRRVFSVSGSGVWAETPASLVSSGSIDLGQLTFGITEKKIPLYVDVTLRSGWSGTVTCQYALDGAGTFTSAGTHQSNAQDPTNRTFALPGVAADQVEIRLILERGSPSSGPVVQRVTVRSQPVPVIRRLITLPILLSDSVRNNAREPYRVDPFEELGIIDGWRTTKDVVTVQIGSELYTAVVEDYDFLALAPTSRREGWRGSCIVTLKTV